MDKGEDYCASMSMLNGPVVDDRGSVGFNSRVTKQPRAGRSDVAEVEEAVLLTDMDRYL